MANIALLVPSILKWEGTTFTNNPNDAGGATKDGVTLNTFNAWFKEHTGCEATVDDLKNLSITGFTDILKEDFWDKAKADDINSQAVANIIVDWFWGSGYDAIKGVQRLLGVTADGIIGTGTLGAINEQDEATFVNQIADARIEFYKLIVSHHPNWGEFLQGWTNRANYYRVNQNA
jgi:lysozyme family protein